MSTPLSIAAAAGGGSPPTMSLYRRFFVGRSHTDTGVELMPHWWLFLVPLYWFPQRICWVLIQTYLLPFQVATIVGNAGKHRAYALMIVCSNVGSFIGPIWGALSDKSVWSDGRRARRPWVVVGQLLFCIACLLMAFGKVFWVFLLSYLLYTATATISGAPYTSIFTTVPTEQRGLYNSLQSWQGLFVSFIVAALGVLLGEKVFSNDNAYTLIIALSIFPTIPLGLMGLGEKPGWMTPEPMAPVLSAEQQEAERNLRRQGVHVRINATFSDFVSAFKYPPFRWLFITNIFNTCYSSIANLFFIYWFQDEVGGPDSNFVLLGHHITHSPRTALAFTSTMSTICSFFLVFPGGYIADRFVDNRAVIMLISALLQTSAPLINAFLPTFTWVCFSSLISGVIGGLTGPASSAMLADCVPVNPATGKPFAPARDYMVMSYSGIVPTLILPGILGVVFDSFSSPALAYKSFFLAASCLHLTSSFLYLKVWSTYIHL